MAFTPQNDLGTVPAANAYITEEEFRAYWLDKNVDVTALASTVLKGLIVQATQYIDLRFQYYGSKLEGRGQTTAFPRGGLYDKECEPVVGISMEVKNACAEYAYFSNTLPLGTNSSSNEQNITLEKDKVDVLETERQYAGTKQTETTFNIYQIADNILLTSGFVVTLWGMHRA